MCFRSFRSKTIVPRIGTSRVEQRSTSHHNVARVSPAGVINDNGNDDDGWLIMNMNAPGRCLLIIASTLMIVAGQGQGGSDRTAGSESESKFQIRERCRRWIHHSGSGYRGLVCWYSAVRRGTNTSPNLDDRRCQCATNCKGAVNNLQGREAMLNAAWLGPLP